MHGTDLRRLPRYPDTDTDTDTDTLLKIHTDTDTDTDTQNSNRYRYQIPIPKIHTDTDTRYRYLAWNSYRYRYQKNPPIPEVIPISIPIYRSETDIPIPISKIHTDTDIWISFHTDISVSGIGKNISIGGTLVVVVGVTYTKFSVLLWAKALVLA